MTTALQVHGVDISHHQGGIRIAWATLKKAGVKWMYHKATEGSSVKDSAYARRRKEAADNGMPFGAYHFARPSGGDARSEARFAVDVADPKPTDLRLCLDLETKEFVSGQALLNWADAFCDEVEKLTNAIPVVYTPYHLSKELEDKALFWVPRYNDDNERPFRDWDIWQFSNGVLGVPDSVPGLGHVDLNYSPKVTVAALDIKSEIKPPPSRGRNVDAALKLLAEAKGGGERARLIERARQILKKINPNR